MPQCTCKSPAAFTKDKLMTEFQDVKHTLNSQALRPGIRL